MAQPSIIVDRLGKSYRLGLREEPYLTFRDALIGAAKAPFKRLRSLSEHGNKLDTLWALKDVNFEVQPGEVVGIIGRNGAGKSTLLKVLSRITEPTEGTVRLRGRVASLLEVGTGFHSELTGRENIYLNGSILGMKRVEINRKFDEIVAFSEVEKFLDTPVKRYSSGMYIRLAFAVAAHLEPEILIVDEVLAVGDIQFQKKCLGKMGEVTRQGRTVLFVSHNMPSIRTLCHSCCVMQQGRLTFRGETGMAIDHYMSRVNASDLSATRSFQAPGSDRPWMRSATLRSDGADVSTIKLGDSLSISVEYAAPDSFRHPRVGFIIRDNQGHALVSANNRYQPFVEPEITSSQGVITCDLGMVPLMPGRYSVSLYFGDFAHNAHIEEDALFFDVIEHDIWGLGKTPPRSMSSLWWPTRFHVSSLAQDQKQ